MAPFLQKKNPTVLYKYKNLISYHLGSMQIHFVYFLKTTKHMLHKKTSKYKREIFYYFFFLLQIIIIIACLMCRYTFLLFIISFKRDKFVLPFFPIHERQMHIAQMKEQRERTTQFD